MAHSPHSVLIVDDDYWGEEHTLLVLAMPRTKRMVSGHRPIE